MIEIQGLSIFYGKRKLAYPDISVKKGEAVGIAGAAKQRCRIFLYR